MPTAYQTQEDKPLFERGLSLFVKTLLLIILGIVLIWGERQLSPLQALRTHSLVVINPIQAAADTPRVFGNWIDNAFSTRNQLSSDNQKLKQQQLLQDAKLQKMAALIEENNRIRLLLDSAERLKEKVLIAEIISIDIDPYQHQILLNKGSKHGAFVGQPIIDSKGIAGQLIEVGLTTSIALLITDTDHAIPVEINRTGTRTIVDGTGNIDRLKLNWLSKSTDIRSGDLLVTSGLGGRFPSGYPVGTITQVHVNAGKEFATAFAKPSAEINQNRHLLLVWNTQQNAADEVE